jgi:Fe-S-cluster containining protein
MAAFLPTWDRGSCDESGRQRREVTMNTNRKGRPPRRDDLPATSCSCRDCRAACLNSPGWFTPDQIAPLARHLKLDVDEVFTRYLAVGVTQMPGGAQRHGVMPHKLRDGKKPGSLWTLAELAQPGRCVFFDRGRCTIYPVRPYECARMMHDRPGDAVRLRHRIVPQWTTAALRRFGELVGRKLSGGAARPRAK